VVRGNKTVYICFLLAFAIMAASPMRAADLAVPAAEPRPLPGTRQTFSVHADPRTGKLIRTVRITDPNAPAKASKAPPKQISDLIEQSAQAHQVDPLLVQSIVKVESDYNPYAISNKGAEGLMQLMPPTARMLGVANSFDPKENIEAGVKYLKYLQGIYKDDRLALAAYNAGPKNVDKYKQVPPFKETQNYVEQVGRRYEQARAEVKAAAPKPEVATPAAAPAPVVETHPKLEPYIDDHGRLSLKTRE
jgi:soluble lytic murein transglycosylase-like protein